MKVAFPQEDIQLLAKILQEQLLAEVQSGELFQVKCAVKNNELMILTQHPLGVIVDQPTIFTVLEEALQRQPNYQFQETQLFLRVSGEKLPYAKHCLSEKVQKSEADEELATPKHWNLGVMGNSVPSSSSERESGSLIFPPTDIPIYESPSIDDSILDNLSLDEVELEEAFDPLAGSPDLAVSKSAKFLQPIIIGVALVGGFVFGGGAYFLTRPCAISECEEIQKAELLKTESRRLTRQAKSEKDLVAVQQQLLAASSDLKKIPNWAFRHQQAEELSASLSAQSQKISLVINGLQAASLVEEKMLTPANNLAELQARLRLWRQAIAPLEAISPNSELYGLVQAKLPGYRVGLQTTNQQLLKEEIWLKKLTAAKAVALTAVNNEANAKSGNDWQKLESTWLLVVNGLKSIPQSSPAYQEAQNLLAEYQPKLLMARDRATQEKLAAKTYQQAINTANQAKVYTQKQQWKTAVTYWSQALQVAQQVSRDSLYYSQAQSLLQPYSDSLQQAQEKLQIYGDLEQTRADLTKTCTNGIQICTFTISDQGIIVRLTPAYDQALQNSSANPDADLKNHFQSLREALVVIGDNAKRPLFIYNSQGQEMYMRMPEYS
ncbi:hypothetical protein Cylst_1464 [Cylindrospermum stagnale PCC 7417]|uniref:Uncharacterized protein n=1 Tax=Cylindrospermum stagnale PCC 7417 TaxID=56107 RepID=K9WU70_9NOST|nr:hypothetical protein [Cylindrospermum stagnale]AFZ23748.1 hypothetical protein Cylst_1464 [Cylindrospermum stagnale PCC 7417]